MSEVQFAVSAKTARLIGRENISDVDGAIIELIKNSYDADATCVFVLFNIPFPQIPQTISYEVVNAVFGKDISKLLEYYTDSGTVFNKRADLNSEQELHLNDFLFSKNNITVMDNGSGMDERTLRFAWMNIGTNDKEERRVSPGGRIKTGAKGIGRFALDKLSKSTVVFTKSDTDSLKKWKINWEQFETATLLNEVTATIEDYDKTFYHCAENVAKSNFNGFKNYNWDSGTIISLSPTRETWSEKYFEKVNKNLKSLFPSTNTSQFDIYVTNVFYPKHSFTNERFSLNESEYDYKITGSFDGNDIISVSIARNEIDTRKLKITTEIDEKNVSFLLSDFWDRDAFKKENHIRSDFAKTVTYILSAQKLTKLEPVMLASVGAFTVELYFIKNSSSTIEIVKPVNASRRKELLSNFSGIKLYRDGFKVRPYGDGEQEGPNFDWLSLGLRAQKSPAAVSHSGGSWRVRSNQMIGEVRISKDANPNLDDMANREGLATNDAYKAFVLIIQKIIETFEADRQYVFKEYALWLKSKIEEQSKVKSIINTVRNSRENDSNKQYSYSSKQTHTSEESYTKSDYEKTIYELDQERERQERATKTMMLYSSSGVMTNTFSHEICRIMTQAGSRMQHLRAAIKRIIGDEYVGNELFNPYTLINKAENVDKLLENWLEVLMSGTDNDAFIKKSTNIRTEIENIISRWKPLLEKKLIEILPISANDDLSSYICSIAEIDLIIIMNNFLLNSADFLEKATAPKREISINISEEENRFVINLENNGPPLDGIFSNNPDRIFDAGVSTKQTEKGTGSGIGLWITRTLVHNNSGEIHVLDKKDGFGLRICLPK